MASHLFQRRIMLLGLAAVLSGCASKGGESVREKRVLFVCLHGSVKSPVAREHLRRMAAERGIPLIVQSRGIDPSDAVSPTLATALKEDGVDTRSDALQRLTANDLAEADIIVVFNPLPAEHSAHTARDWSDVPSMNGDYAAARAALIVKLEAMLDEIAANTVKR